jgi:hypothetical protein
MDINAMAFSERCASCEKADRTNSTFDFFANTQAKPEKPKELFFANA